MYCADRHRPGGRDAAADFGFQRETSSVIAISLSTVAPVARLRRAATIRSDAGEHQRQRQQHAHGEPAPQKAELRVGLAEQFADQLRAMP